MAGLGRKVFSPGEVLTATNVQNYLMDQAVQVYAGTASRGSAIGTATTEGMVSYLADTNVVEVYDGSLWKQVYPAVNVPTTGQVVQVVSTTKADTFTTTSTSITDVTGLAVTITPKSSSNKIIVLLNTTISATASGTHNYQLFRDSTYIGGGLSGTYVTDYSAIGTQNGQYNVSANFLDSPSTSSAITYKLRVSTSAGTLAINRRALANDMGSISTITVMEVVG
jgi:hypothetical protein